MKITPRDVPLDLPVVSCPIPYNRDGAYSFLQKSRMRRLPELLAGRRTKAQNKAQSLLPEGPRANPRLTWKPTKLPTTARVVTLSDVKILHNGAKVPRGMALRGWTASAWGPLRGHAHWVGANTPLPMSSPKAPLPSMVASRMTPILPSQPLTTRQTYSHFTARCRLSLKTIAFENLEDSCRSGTATPARLRAAHSSSV